MIACHATYPFLFSGKTGDACHGYIATTGERFDGHLNCEIKVR